MKKTMKIWHDTIISSLYRLTYFYDRSTQWCCLKFYHNFSGTLREKNVLKHLFVAISSPKQKTLPIRSCSLWFVLNQLVSSFLTLVFNDSTIDFEWKTKMKVCHQSKVSTYRGTIKMPANSIICQFVRKWQMDRRSWKCTKIVFNECAVGSLFINGGNGNLESSWEFIQSVPCIASADYHSNAFNFFFDV